MVNIKRESGSHLFSASTNIHMGSLFLLIRLLARRWPLPTITLITNRDISHYNLPIHTINNTTHPRSRHITIVTRFCKSRNNNRGLLLLRNSTEEKC
jgi:hypothetical protein